jgi:hypothetical protein
MKTRPCTPGKNQRFAKTSRRRHFDFLLGGASFKSTDWKKRKRRNIDAGLGFGRFLAAKIEFMERGRL